MEVISGTEISGQVVKLIESAREHLVLVSPYFDPWERLDTAIRGAYSHHGVKVRLLVRGGKDRDAQESKSRSLRTFGVEVAFLTKLHAKIYVSESQAIVTSLNLLESSALNSWEIAMRLDAVRDAKAYAEVVAATTDLLKRAEQEEGIHAQPVKAAAVSALKEALSRAPAAPPQRAADTARFAAAPTPSRAAPSATPAKASAPAPKKRAPVGHCIRCADPIPFSTDHPYCESCYKSWVKYKNPDYEEKHCHSCGKAKAATMAKPLCKPCWEATA